MNNIAQLQDTLRQAFDNLDAERNAMLARPNANPDQIQITITKRYAQAYCEFKAKLEAVRPR